MSNSDFQSRIARLNEKHTAAVQEKKAAPKPRRSLRAALREKGEIGVEMLITPLFLFVGFAIVILARIITYHYLSEDGTQGLRWDNVIVSILGDIGIEMALSSVVLVFLMAKKMWLPMVANVIGAYTSMWYEVDFMRMYPELWSKLYSPEYVIRTLYNAEVLKFLL